MDAVSDPTVKEVWVMKSAQVGWTEILNNVIGFHVDQDPAPILLVQPTLEMAEAWSKDRLAPMIRDTPALHGRIADPKARDSGNTLLHKALALDTPLPTPDGWTTVGAVGVGDTLLDESGRACRVTDTTPVYEGRPCYRVRFSDGEEIVADEEHLWSVERWVVEKTPHPRQTIAADLIATGQMAARVRAGRRFRFAVRVARPLALSERPLPLPPYALGVWLGDGYSHRALAVMLPEDAAEVVTRLRAEGLDATIRPVAGRSICEILLEPPRDSVRGADGRIRPAIGGVRGALAAMGLLSRGGDGKSRKAIPRDYLRASVEQRTALLQGLMDTDGSVTPAGWCRYVTVSPALADGVEELLLTLGIKPSRTQVRTTGAYVIGFQSPDFPVFTLQRKRERQRPPTSSATRRRIVAVDAVQSVPVRCVTVDSPSHLFLAGRRMVPTHNSFTGGRLTVAGANSPSGLAARPIRIVLFDEVDRFPTSAGTEGDPISLGVKRTRTFWNRKVLAGSTPTIKGSSRIERGFEQSDQRYFYVPCPHCDEFQRLVWSQVRWPDGEPDRAVYVCPHCGVELTDADKPAMLTRGEWRASRASSGVAGFHISELYSPWSSWPEMAVGFLRAKSLPETLQTWINTSLGETWEDAGETLEAEGLASRREAYTPQTLPHGVLLLTLGTDVQDNRLECTVWGWGLDEEAWRVEHIVLKGDPGGAALYADHDALLDRKYRTDDGRELLIEACAIDSGGHFTEQVYRYASRRQRRRVWAIKGVAGAGRLAWPKKASKVRRGTLYPVGVDTVKDVLYQRMKRVLEPGPGYVHFDATTDDEWLEQLTSETIVHRVTQGRRVRLWRPRKSGIRQEALDCTVYAYCALQGRGGAALLQTRAARPVSTPHTQPLTNDTGATEQAQPAPASKPPAPRQQAQGWVSPRRGSWFRR